MKEYLSILRRNLLSPIVITILTLSAVLFILHQVRDAWFLSFVIVVNTLLAIIQEIRAKRALKKLELMSAPYAKKLIGDSKFEKVLFENLNPGDEVVLELGDEIPADGELLASSGLEADESIMTGESAPVEKASGEMVYAASSVTAGSATMRVTAVGAATKVGLMTATLKRYKPTLTPIQKAISVAITWLTYGALALALLIFVTYRLSGHDAVMIFRTIAAAAVVVVPEGLLLASSLLLAYGSLKLAQAKVLPQKLTAIEGMALLDVLCVDKTGTLTEDKIRFDKFESFGDPIENISDLMGIVAKETDSGSSTGRALSDAFSAPKNYKVLQTLAFSSDRKMSGVKVLYGSNKYSILIGAPEYIGKLSAISKKEKGLIEELTSEGKRVLAVAMFNDTRASLKNLAEGSGSPIGLLVFSNELREGVEKTVEYLQNNGVTIKVISGDNPNTVKYVASQAGIVNHHKIITGLELAQIPKSKWDKVVSETTIFARVLPEQKEKLVKTFKRLGNYTGMVGDGVNDALALKRADLGVAMFSGAVASRRVADIVLLNNSFNSLPIGMRLGNRIIQAIEIIATLFFHKIIFGVVLLLSTLAFGLVYPFDPRHVTFMGIFLVTMPTLMWTLFPPSPRHRLSPKYFWKDTLLAVAPISALSGIMITASYAWLKMMHPLDRHGVSTVTVMIATFFGIYLVYLVPRMFDVRNTRKSQIARALYTLGVFIVIIPSITFSFTRNFFNFSLPTWYNVWPILFVILATAILQWVIATEAGRRLRSREP
jgi:cation-transporting ATPase E